MKVFVVKVGGFVLIFLRDPRLEGCTELVEEAIYSDATAGYEWPSGTQRPARALGVSADGTEYRLFPSERLLKDEGFQPCGNSLAPFRSWQEWVYRKTGRP